MNLYKEMTKEMDEKRLAKFYTVVLILSFAMTAICLIQDYYANYTWLRGTEARDVAMDTMGLMVCNILTLSVTNDKPWDARNRKLSRLIFVMTILLFADCLVCYAEGELDMSVLVHALGTIETIGEAILVYCFWSYIREELTISEHLTSVMNRIFIIFAACKIVVTVINIKFGFLFTISEMNTIEWQFGSVVDDIISLIMFVLVGYAIAQDDVHPSTERAMLLTFVIFPGLMQCIGAVSLNYDYMYPTYVMTMLLIYINIFGLRSKKIAEQQVTLDKQNTALMISQIQPHFLYNTLTTISNLCTKDPVEAEETTVMFSRYLRTNLDSLRTSEPVPFSMEMDHVEIYVELEKKRFKEKLNVEYDIQDTSFLVPSLGLQPLVENSIKHGICQKEEPGHLLISSRKVEGGHEVVIEDDGVGFDTSAPAPQDGRSHVGMTNVKSRLEKMCNARVDIVSAPGQGCKTTIFFPDR